MLQKQVHYTQVKLVEAKDTQEIFVEIGFDWGRRLHPTHTYELEVFIEHIPRAERQARMHAVQLQST